jgi:hypothetical protein
MVWEVLGSSKGVWEAYGIRAKGEEEAPTKLKSIFPWRSTKGGVTLLGGCNFWDEEKKGSEVKR